VKDPAKKQKYVQPEVKTVAEHPKATGGQWIDHVGGRKLFICFLGMVACVVLAFIRDDIPTKEVIDTMKWLVAIGAGSIAVEDGIGRAFSRKG
jgi:hypothetical protein